ncbi:glycoside hydrolase domain-containing protein [Nocardioides marmorisolisilvae]|uniref:DUF1906 domain-containing protein n=1 Tax=Nocardioides marmorisolisilvae TaxID=1542737 RepID=A0A3N0DPU0_9ACTN|nr:glycoside hydrolase domain-containing protein [Nocardioides marmorisolisilvae]RNL77660.1 DUF1906 domain-containing protein [Nocardioides marmorisolisilvae]
MSFTPSRRISAAVIVLLVGSVLLGPGISTADAGGNPATPGNFTGKAFDQCSAPSQRAMNVWRRHSPYRGVGVYISGASRACHQRHLTRTWVRKQLAHGWKLLPIHVGPQASCNRHAHLRGHRISANPRRSYARARAQGRAEARSAVRAARRLGLSRGSTIFYDLEAFSTRSASCRNSSLRFLSSWTQGLRSHGYVSGVYSSASSGIKLLDRARWARSGLTLPQQIWVADWNGRANTHSSYLHAGSWTNSRVKQYRGGHTERHGGVAINIDSNYVDLRVHRTRKATHHAKVHHTTKHHTKAQHPKHHATRKHQAHWVYLPGGSTPEVQNPVADRLCTTRRLNLATYFSTGVFRRENLHARLQCVLKQNGLYPHDVNGYWGRRTAFSVNKLQSGSDRKVRTTMTRGDWVSLLVTGNHTSWLRRGVRGADVVRVQRALHAAGVYGVYITGRYDRATQRAVKTYQRRVGIRATGTVGAKTWRYLAKGRV